LGIPAIQTRLINEAYIVLIVSTMDYTAKESELIIKLDGKAIARLGIHVEGNKIHFDSTYTPEKYRGKGIGSQLIEAGIDYAKKKRLKIVPVCNFSVEYFKKHPEHADLLWKE
jgi:predicted GNAT family acetyltransferase